MRIDLKILCVAACASVLLAQDTRPSCNKCSGTYITSGEIQAYLKRAPADAVSDQQVRAVDVGKSNVDIGVVYRGKQTAGGAVADGDVLDLFWRAGGDPEAGTSIWRVLEAASAGGLAGVRLAGFDQAEFFPGDDVGQAVADMPADAQELRPLALSVPAIHGLDRHAVPLGQFSGAQVSVIGGRHPSSLLLGLELPGPHAVLATADGWWSWGELHDPAEWPDAAAEEAWAISWVVA